MKKKTNFQAVWECSRGGRLAMALSIASMLLAAAASLVDPAVIGFALDAMRTGDTPAVPAWLGAIFAPLGGAEFFAANLWACAALIVAASALSGGFVFLRGWLSSYAAERMAQNLRDRLFAKVNELPYGYFGRVNTGDLLQRCSSDVETLRRFVSSQIVDVGRATTLIALTALAMLTIDLRMTLVSMPIAPIVLAFSYFFYGRVKKAFEAADERESEMTQVLQENLRGIRVVRAFARGGWEESRFEERNGAYADAVVRLVDLLGGFWSISSWLCMAQTCATLAFGAAFAGAGLVSVGAFASFFAYVGRLYFPIRQLGRTLTDLGKASVAAKRVTEVLSERGEFEPDGGAFADGEAVPDTKGAIEFDDVSFEYEEGRPVLSNVSFRIEPGQTVALLGRTGSGKSTIAQLVARLADPKSGSVRIGGTDLRRASKRELRKRVALVLQEPFLFSMSLRDNVELGIGAADPGAIEAAAETAGMARMVAGFEEGWDTQVGEHGVTLSGGQRQRAAIARTLATRPDILVLDDSLSAVDTETDAAIRASLAKDGGGTTTLIIAHRLTTLAKADRILVLEKGRIAQSGTHEELIRRDGLYRSVWEIQAGVEREMGGLVDSADLESSPALPAPGGRSFAAGLID
jgi:ATP-binding cassette subfamily B protein